jgi:hypothetical protein
VNVGWRHGTSHEALGADGPPDAAFPRRREVLDPQRVAAAFTEAAPEADDPASPGGDRLLDVYYYPGRTLQAVHRLGTRIVTVHAAPVGVSLLPAPGDLVLPGLHAVARTFPADPGLPTLASVYAELGAEADLLTYLPGLRCVLGGPDRVAKVRTPEETVRAHHRQVELWATAGRGFRMAEPLTVDAERAVRWERRVAGRSVESCLGEVPPAELANLVAGGLASLHSLDLDSPAGRNLPRLGADQLLDRLERKTLRTIGRALPALAPRSAALASALRAAGPPDCGPASALHGDFHIANLLLDDDGLILLDLDELSRGDAELDLALFASRLLLVALHRGDELAGSARLIGALTQAYGTARGRALDQRSFAWYLATCLVARQVKTSIRHLAPDLEQLCASLLTLAERTLAQGVFDVATVEQDAA